MKKLRESSRKYAIKLINFEKKKTLPLTKKHQKSKAKVCYIFKKL